MIKKNRFVKNMYLFLLCESRDRAMTRRDVIKQMKARREVFYEPLIFEFMEACGRPGNVLYGEYMKERASKIKDKISTGGGIML